MADDRCSCGFTEDEAADETMGDHLAGAFAPEDGKGTDGLVHLEGEPDLTCTCGLAAATAEELDAHFLTVFTTPDRIGLDGRRHAAVTSP